MSKQTAPPKGWGEVSREELIKREFEMVKRIEKEELTFDGLTPIEFALRELYEFQEATGCDTAAEFKTNLEKDTEGYMQKVIDALYENGDPVSVEAAELFEHMAQQRLKPVAYRSYGAMKNGLTGWRFATHKSTYHDDPNQEPLYTTPQKCKPLTDEQILRANQVIYNGMTCVHIQEDGEPENLLAFARAIEAAHGIYAPPELKE